MPSVLALRAILLAGLLGGWAAGCGSEPRATSEPQPAHRPHPGSTRSQSQAPVTSDLAASVEQAFEAWRDVPNGTDGASMHPPAPRPADRVQPYGHPRVEVVRDREGPEVAGLGDVDPERRAAAVVGLDPSQDAELAALAELVSADPSPLVRGEAARQLGNEESFFCTMSLLGALEDPDPSVVVAAIEALEFSSDGSIASQLEPLLAHQSPAVREAAASAIDFLE